MIKIVNKNECCGCTACVSSCPKNCISMQKDEEGFLYPVTNASACVECGLCLQTCPILKKPMSETLFTTAFAAYSKDTDSRLSSSSGGIFSLLAKEVLDCGGVVYGAAFDEQLAVRHISVEAKDGLCKLRGSKYVQSSLENIFVDVRTALEDGRRVLFSGVICQIAGLKAYLKKEYTNLLTVDVLCHGVPSPKLWKKYISELEESHGSSARQIFFRNKKYGWKSYSVHVDFSNGTAYEQVFFKDPFMQLFLRNICLRPSCHNCHFNEVDRLSDITLGDCWGINRIMPDMDDDKGTSVVLLHTENGRKYFDMIKPQMKFCESDVDSILPPESGGRHSVAPHPKRTQFFSDLDKKSISELVKMAEPSLFEKAKNFSIVYGRKILKKIHIKW